MCVLFDFDGVLMDTETQYSIFWKEQGLRYLGVPDLHDRIKGQTLTYIYNTYFSHLKEEQAEITRRLDDFELNMEFNYVPGALDFIADLRRHGVKMAVVTSSNQVKMSAVYKAHPELKTQFDLILTSEDFTASKPDPYCFLLGMRRLGGTVDDSFVFEDSVNGLKAGMASGARVIGLSTTNPEEVVRPLCHAMIADFTSFTYEQMLRVVR